MSVRGNRVLILIVAALIPVVLLATGWIVDVAHLERSLLAERVRSSAVAARDRLDGQIRAEIGVLQGLATSPLIDAQEWAGLRRQMLDAKRDRPLWSNVVLSSAGGYQVVNANYPESRVPVMHRQSLERAVASARPAMIPVTPGPVSGYMTVGLRVPVKRGERVPYVLTAALQLSALTSLLQGDVPADWRAVIVDQNGRTVVRTTDGAAGAGQPTSDSALQAIAEGREGEIRRGAAVDGLEVLVTYLQSPITGWTVHVGVPTGALTALQAGSLRFAIAGGVISVALAVLLAWLLLRELRARRIEAAAIAETQHLEAIGRITGGIAHDFNNLLMIIQSAALLIRRRNDDPKLVGYSDAIVTATRRGASLTKQLLGYARKERHAPVSFDLRGRADDLLTLLRQSTRGDVETTLTVGDGTWPIYADPESLEVALINLATNARDAMPDGGRLGVSARNVSLAPGADERTGLAGDYVAISVADTGLGIPADDLSRVFKPFFTTKEPGRGTGLGLSQVQGFARQSDGAVTVTSVVGTGTCFTLYLPRGDKHLAGNGARARSHTGAAGGRVLLVDDNAEVASAIEAMLVSAGFEVTTAASVEAALARLDGGAEYDVVLSDIVMPGRMSGLDLAERLRDRKPPTTLVLMTGYSDALTRGTGRAAEVEVEILSKPFQESDLLAAFQRARSRCARSTRRSESAKV